MAHLSNLPILKPVVIALWQQLVCVTVYIMPIRSDTK